MDDRVAVLGPDEVPGPATMCFQWLKPRHRCALKPGHEGDHAYTEFKVTYNTEEK